MLNDILQRKAEKTKFCFVYLVFKYASVIHFDPGLIHCSG